MKTIKFRIVEKTTIRGFVESVVYTIQLKNLLGWRDYTINNGGLIHPKEFESKRDCFNELFKKSGKSLGHVKLHRYPTLKYIYAEKIPS